MVQQKLMLELYTLTMLSKSIKHGGEKVVAQAQWDSLPNYMEGINERVLPVVDVPQVQ